jgi:hypothetical protein
MKNLLASVLAAGAVVVAAPVAHAGPWDDPSLTPAAQDYVNHAHIAICEALQADPSPNGVDRVFSGVQTQGHFSYRDAAIIMNVSVSKTCKRFMPLLQSVGTQQRALRRADERFHWRYGGGILV